MKAIRVYVDETDTGKVGNIIERINEHEDTVATMVGAKELFIAAVGVCAMRYVTCIIELEFGDRVSIQYVK